MCFSVTFQFVAILKLADFCDNRKVIQMDQIRSGQSVILVLGRVK